MSRVNEYPYELESIDSETAEYIKKYFKGLRTYSNFVRIGSKRYLFPEVPNLKLQMYSIYNMALTSTDIFVSTFPRSGTTLTQELVWLVANNLDYNTAKSKNLIERYTALGSYIVNPQIEFTRLDKYKQADCSNLDILIKMITPPSEDLVASVGGRFIKNHLPLSLLPPNTLDTAKMIYVARDPRDVAVSLYFLSKLLVLFDFDGDFETFWDLFVRDLIVRTPYFEQVKEAWAMRNHPNMLFIFYDDLVKDMTTTIRKISRFLNKNYSNEQINGLKQHLQLENFRNNGSVTWDFIVEFNALNLSAAPFIRKGRVGGWRDHFNKDMAEQAEIWIQQNLYDTDLKFPLS